jgi:hypothetical protein
MRTSVTLRNGQTISVEQWRQWKLEKDLLDAKLREILDRAKELKASPTASATSKRGARMVETFIQQLGSHLPIGELEPVRAAFQALHVGVFADDAIGRDIKLGALAKLESDAAALAKQRKNAAPKGGQKRGKQIAAAAATDDPVIRKCVSRWNQSDETREEFGTFAKYARKMTDLPGYKIRRRLKKLALTLQQ